MKHVLIFQILTAPFVIGFPSISYQVDNFSSNASEILLNRTCPSEEHWSNCHANCQKSCNKLNETSPCPELCVSGCVCDAGFVRGYDGKCTLPKYCLSAESTNSLTFDEFCPPNEKFSKCHAHCQRNCLNWSDHTLNCLKICVPGCICENGMVRGPHGNCIRPRLCPSSYLLNGFRYNEIECPTDEHYVRCTAHCQRNCSNWNQNTTCQDICISGCVCDIGYVRNIVGKCVQAGNCSVYENALNKTERTNSCLQNEQISMYQSLPNSNKYCIYDFDALDVCPPTFTNGCVCNQGFVRSPDQKCIDLRLLPSANELEFIHGSIYVEEINETISNSEFITIETSNITITDTSKELSEQNEWDSYGDCPDYQICTHWCRNRNYTLGACMGRTFSQCVCL